MQLVTTLNDSGAGSLRAAIAAASVGEEIQFSVTGTILLTSAQLLISQDLIITGPGSGSLTVDGGGAFRVFDTDTGVISISGLTVDFGFAALGAGIHNEATLTLSNVRVINSVSTNDGGGIWNSGSIDFTNCAIDACQATGGDGGGIWNTGTLSGFVAISNCTSSGDGAGVWDDGTFDHDGGEITGCTSSGAIGGGGIHINGGGGTYRPTEVTIDDNSAPNGQGDGVFNSFGTVEVTRCTISNHDFIGIYSSAGSVFVENSTVSGNGGTGIYNALGALDIKHSTITNNNFGITQDSGSVLDIFDTILSGNTGGDYDGETADVTSGGHNIFGNDTNPVTPATGDQIVLSFGALVIGPLQNNGGPTETHALLAGSPAIDAGSNADAPTTDQRGTGFPRVIDTIDIGAFESDISGEVIEATGSSVGSSTVLGVSGARKGTVGSSVGSSTVLGVSDNGETEPPGTGTEIPPPGGSCAPEFELSEEIQPCTPLLDAPTDYEACTPESTVELPVIAACAPLPFQPTIWNSTKCFTASCPDGFVGPDVTRCATATSQISQADADAKALAAAQEAAEAELVCTPVPTFSDQATLVLSLSGIYELLGIFEATELELDFTGSYEIASPEDLAELVLTITGEYVILPIEEPFSLVLTMSPLCEYRLETLPEATSLALDLTGSYGEPVITTPNVAESASVTMTLSGLYNENTTLQTFSESLTLSMTSFSGVYTLVAIPPPDQSNSATLAVSNFSGDYVLRVISLPERQFNMTLGLTLTGVYA